MAMKNGILWLMKQVLKKSFHKKAILMRHFRENFEVFFVWFFFFKQSLFLNQHRKYLFSALYFSVGNFLFRFSWKKQ